MNAYDIIRRPVITEQSMESVADKKYVFMVDVNANKTDSMENSNWQFYYVQHIAQLDQKFPCLRIMILSKQN